MGGYNVQHYRKKQKQSIIRNSVIRVLHKMKYSILKEMNLSQTRLPWLVQWHQKITVDVHFGQSNVKSTKCKLVLTSEFCLKSFPCDSLPEYVTYGYNYKRMCSIYFLEIYTHWCVRKQNNHTAIKIRQNTHYIQSNTQHLKSFIGCFCSTRCERTSLIYSFTSCRNIQHRRALKLEDIKTCTETNSSDM